MSKSDQYLLAVYICHHRHGSPVSSGLVADLLDRSSPTVVEAFHELDDRGLISYESYQGATLTAEGWERAKAFHESYVTLSWFFRSVLDLETHEAEAMELAAVIDPSVTRRLAQITLHEGDPGT